jgi:hypothetical protein
MPKKPVGRSRIKRNHSESRIGSGWSTTKSNLREVQRYAWSNAVRRGAKYGASLPFQLPNPKRPLLTNETRGWDRAHRLIQISLARAAFRIAARKLKVSIEAQQKIMVSGFSDDALNHYADSLPIRKRRRFWKIFQDAHSRLKASEPQGADVFPEYQREYRRRLSQN